MPPEDIALTPGQFDQAVPISQPVEVEPPKDVDPTSEVIPQPTVGVPSGNVIIQSDGLAEEATQQNEAQLAKISEGLEQARVQAEQLKVTIDEKALQEQKEREVKAQGGLTFEEAQEAFGTDFTGIQQDPDTGLFIPDETALARIDPEAKATTEANNNIDKDFDDATLLLDKATELSSNAEKIAIQAIKDSYERRKTIQKDINNRSLEGLRILGIRSGRQRFAPEIQIGLLSAEERAGQARLAELDAEERSLIAQAEQAADERDFAILQERMNLIRETRDAKAQVAQDLRAATKEAEDRARAQAKESREQIKFLQELESNFIDDISLSVLDEVMLDDGSIDEDLLEEIANERGIDPEKLKSSLLQQKSSLLKQGLDVENIRSQIASRKEADEIRAGELQLKIDKFEVDQQKELDQLSGGLKSKVQALPVGQQESAFSAIATMKSAQRLIKLLDEGVPTGPVTGRLRAGTSIFGIPITPGGTAFGITGEATNDFISASTVFTAQFIKAISGAQVSDKEREFLERALPSLTKQEALNRSGIKLIVETLKDKYETQLGIDFDDFADELKIDQSTEEISLQELFNASF